MAVGYNAYVSQKITSQNELTKMPFDKAKKKKSCISITNYVKYIFPPIRKVINKIK